MRTLSTEAQSVAKMIKEGKSFLLSGGAGSGKTYSLIEVIDHVLNQAKLSQVACITYTNAAVDEIQDRFKHDSLYVATIHEFLWSNIKNFQSELKDSIIHLINDDNVSLFRIKEEGPLSNEYFDNLSDGIQYKEYVMLDKGIISHDELLILAGYMYENYQKLCRITSDKFPYIFVDEYQDTNPIVVKILLEHIKKAKKPSLVGLFGDSMQAIYEGSVGDVADYLVSNGGALHEVKKEQNRRNPQLIIDIANNIRFDGLEQVPSSDIDAPNMLDGKIKKGEFYFLHSKDFKADKVKKFLGWDFESSNECKQLNLTHNLIAGKAGFEELMRIYDGDKIMDYVKRIKKYIKSNSTSLSNPSLSLSEVVEELKLGLSETDHKKVLPTNGMQKYIDDHSNTFSYAMSLPFSNISSIYVDKDQLLDDKKDSPDDVNKPSSKRDELIKHLFRIQKIITLYVNSEFNEFLNRTDYKITSIKDKKILNSRINSLIKAQDKTIADVIKMADEYGLVKIDDRLKGFIINKEYIYRQVCCLPFCQFQSLYNYLEGFTPFSTKHKTKGAEYPNVLVILDNGKWNSYNFDYMFTEPEGKESIIARSKKIFYVCCTRAREKLAIFYHNPSQDVLSKATDLFGQESIINLDAEL